jgi:TrmH family RNA methyltransferase
MALSRRRAKLVARLTHRKTREREGLVLVEGVRTVAEALEAGCRPRFTLLSSRLAATPDGDALALRIRDAGAEVDEVPDADLAALAPTETPQGILLVAEEPRVSLGEALRPGGRHLLLDALQDPGNVGTLIRAAAAFALDAVVALDGTADPWSPKTVRASAGMVFRLPVAGGRAEEALELLGGRGLPLLVADAGGRSPHRLRFTGGWALAVGNEGSGVRPALLEACEARVGVPMPGPAESLNAGVAGAILLYALTTPEASGAASR